MNSLSKGNEAFREKIMGSEITPADEGIRASWEDKHKQRGRPKKPESEKRKRISASLPPEQYAYLKSLKHQSEYIESLIADDMTRKGIV